MLHWLHIHVYNIAIDIQFYILPIHYNITYIDKIHICIVQFT
jgi:hypothetical protein